MAKPPANAKQDATAKQNATAKQDDSSKQDISAKQVFVSYSHCDEEQHEKLVKHLSMLERGGHIQAWHDRCIIPGAEWGVEIDKHLESASLVLLLISSDFLASEYCFDIEMKRALEKHKDGTAIVIPIMLRPVDISGAPFAKLQILPKNAKPVSSWEDEDEAFKNISEGIRRALSPPGSPVAISIDTPPAGPELIRNWFKPIFVVVMLLFISTGSFAAYKLLIAPSNVEVMPTYMLPSNADYDEFVELIRSNSPDEREAIANDIVDLNDYRWDLKILGLNETGQYYVCGSDETETEAYYHVYVYPQEFHAGASGRELKDVEGKLGYKEINGSNVYYIAATNIGEEILPDSLTLLEFVNQISSDPKNGKNYVGTCFEDWEAIFDYGTSTQYRVKPEIGSDVTIQLNLPVAHSDDLGEDVENKRVIFSGIITEIKKDYVYINLKPNQISLVEGQ